jgi:DNA-binding PadR family transcriptional regulator
MGGGLFLGEFEQIVLLAVARLDDAYGMTIRREIEERTGRSVSIGSVYITLDRLLSKGYIEEEVRKQTREDRARRLFQLTREGVNALELSRRTQESMWKGVVLKVARKRT